MAREFSAANLVVLPKLGVDSALALYQALQAAVTAEKKLPKFLQPAWSSLHDAGAQLIQAAQARFSGSSTKVPYSEKRKADGVMDNAVAALDEFLGAWARFAGTLAKGQIAASVRQTLFPDSTGFLRLSYNEEWVQVDRRLQLVKREGLDKQLDLLGAAEILTQVEEAHAAYGKALGLTAVPEPPTETVALNEPLTELSSALRLYVIKVTAYADEADPETVALSERLLRPLVTWTSKTTKPTDDGEPDPTPPAENQ